MDDNENKSSWDDLIEDLGAKPDKSAFERKQPPPQEIPPSVDWSEAAEIAEPESAPGDWNSLAESLGLEVEPEPVAEEPTAEDSSSEVIAEKPVEAANEPEVSREARVDALASDTSANEPFGGSLAPAEEESLDDAQDETAQDDAEQDDSETFVTEDELPPLPSKMDQALSDSAWDEDSTSADTNSAVDEDVDSEGISGEAARSAFDALFSDGASSWGSAFLDKPKRDFGKSAPESSTDEVVDRAEDAEVAAGGAGTDEADTDGEDRPKRKRSRRRRRGGRGRKPAGEQVEADSTTDETADSDSADDPTDNESTDDEPKKPRRRRSRSRPRTGEKRGESVSADTDGEETDSEADDGIDDIIDGEDRPRGRQRHRSIPTWSDAIGMIVDGNLEQRAKSPSKPQSSRGGRGRGGRRRGGRKPEGKQ